MQQAPIADFQSAPFNGPFAELAALLPHITAAPFEGLWIPTRFLRQGSLELVLDGTAPAAQADLYATNVGNPLNTYQVTVGGSATSTDVVTLNFTGALLPSAGVAVAYTVQGGDTLNSIAAAIAALVSANTALLALGVQASASGAVVTVTWPSVSPSQPSGQPSSPPIGNTIGLTTSLSGGATETATVSLGTDGQLFQSLTAPGIIAVNAPFPVANVKARLVSLTGTNPVATLRLSGVP